MTLTTTQARASLPEVLDRVMAGEEVTITRHGRPVAVVVRPDALRSRRAHRILTGAAAISDHLAEARRAGRPQGGVTVERAEELLAEVRAGRRRS